MKIETMLHAQEVAENGIVNGDYSHRMRTRNEWGRLYMSMRAGIMRRYIRLQQENARLSAAMSGMNGDFIATMERNRACNVEYENRIAALQAENADLQHEINVLRAVMTPEHKDIDAVLVEIQAENAKLRDEVAFWKAEALKDGDGE